MTESYTPAIEIFAVNYVNYLLIPFLIYTAAIYVYLIYVSFLSTRRLNWMTLSSRLLFLLEHSSTEKMSEVEKEIKKESEEMSFSRAWKYKPKRKYSEVKLQIAFLQKTVHITDRLSPPSYNVGVSPDVRKTIFQLHQECCRNEYLYKRRDDLLEAVLPLPPLISVLVGYAGGLIFLALFMGIVSI